ncbi:outer membrane protein with beta-barrel domain [Mucilaginibacter frigoritolerans]|uniref:Outer membrane protein with beta-barrel domain n=1 Tax=Mucilaginibacter frigoritolerans TaxID=652788 RepID=A0A562TWG6_9SPHI|nr:outer membrane beta-barrel protein [Mucilaginibacter frigoritolerans]TWI97210.1 outer membrane protein with beta-barrel domain [Mucilaginibacter frigoritolerans]
MKCLTKALLAFLLIMPLFSLAQSNYKPGYVITLKGDTLHGFIDYREWNSNPNSINFKITLNATKPQSFTPVDIVYFNIDDIDAYQTYAGKISTDGTNAVNPSSRDTSFKIASVFLKILQKGKNLELFSYTDRIKSRFYIGEAPGYKPLELEYRLYVDANAQNSAGGIVTENTYLKQLFALANKYDAMDSELEKIFQAEGYSDWFILKIVSKINKISASNYKKNHKVNSGVKLFVNAGINVSNISPGSTSSFALAGGKSNTSFGPTAGFGIAILPNANTGKLQLRAEVTIGTASYSSLYENKVSPYIGVKASFNDLIIAFAPEIIYNFYNGENFKFYAGAGILIGYNNYSNAVFGPQNPNDNFDGTASNDPYYFRNTETSFVIKAGIQFSKNWGIFADYVSSVPLTSGGYFQLNNTQERVGINYLFK